MRAAVLAAVLAAVAPHPDAHAAEPAFALHALFRDGAVLQRDRPLRVWGEAPAGERVQVAVAGRSASARAGADGRWEAELPALPTGGPYTLTARAGEAVLSVEDVLVGDVWLCSGQSNMELQVHRTLDARAEIAGADNPRIRLLTVPQTGSPVPRAGFGGEVRWQPVTPDTVRDFSAACYYFARELQAVHDVPMGLVAAAWGGSRIQAWMSAEALRAVGGHDEALDVLALYAGDPVAAVGRWGETWARWWAERPGLPDGDRPWEPGHGAGGWRAAPPQLGAWERWGVPELADFDGMVWYRTTVELSAAQAAQDAALLLGPADEVDMTWVNGRAVGSTYGAGAPREYPLPAGLLRAGANTVVVNVLDTYRDGGLAGPASLHALRLADGSRVPLDGGWQWRQVPVAYGSPPRAPWQSAAGTSTLHNGMIAPLGRMPLRGALWYQGESNTFEADRYAGLLRGLRSDWRARFGQDLPFLVVQLANYGAAPTTPGESDWAALREAQRRVAADDAHSALAVAIDIGDRYDIHPTNKQEVGRRLARAARAAAFGEALPPTGPVAVAAYREGGAVVVAFEDVTDGLVAYGADAAIGVELCGDATGSCRYAQARAHGDRVVVEGPGAATATRVRHAWADSPLVNLFDRAGLPAGPFELPVRPAPSDESAR
ncbi:sialate O-acetylesterase [Coralloluteibacterium thermophilus]|uniref:Sialate O-acetylesterase n=1 Tax=Coralloluteibacterium thermophilum TaxID=2707049 RepID=A0ABV9NJN1_9GAMM